MSDIEFPQKTEDVIKYCESIPACKKTWIQIQNRPVKEMRKLDLKLVASKRIRDDNGLTLISITGKQQGGKSSYAMLILHEIYKGDVDEIMKHIVFSLADFQKIISDAINGGYREKCIVWDDASLSGGAARWVVDPKSVMYLAGLGDTLGIATKGLILTSPSGDMIKAFRNYTKYKVIISNGKHRYDRVARGYWIGKSPMDQRWCSQEWADAYDTRIPFYEQYAQIRKEISLSAIKNMQTFLHEENGNEGAKEKPITIKERAKEVHRDWLAGVFGDITFKVACIANKINPAYARTVV